MVSNSALAALCVKCGIHQLVDTRAYGISNSLNAYVSAVTTALQEEQRASSREGRPPGQYWLRLQTPKVCPLTPNARGRSDKCLSRHSQTSWKVSLGLYTPRTTAPSKERRNSSAKSSSRSSMGLSLLKCSLATRPMQFWRC